MTMATRTLSVENTLASRQPLGGVPSNEVVLQSDHINGINDDYRLENLRMLCANCHSLTPTHGRRNVGHKKRVPEISFLLAA